MFGDGTRNQDAGSHMRIGDRPRAVASAPTCCASHMCVGDRPLLQNGVEQSINTTPTVEPLRAVTVEEPAEEIRLDWRGIRLHRCGAAAGVDVVLVRLDLRSIRLHLNVGLG